MIQIPILKGARLGSDLAEFGNGAVASLVPLIPDPQIEIADGQGGNSGLSPEGFRPKGINGSVDRHSWHATTSD